MHKIFCLTAGPRRGRIATWCLLGVTLAVGGLAGCFEYDAPHHHHTAHHPTAMPVIQYGPPPPQAVSVAPPPASYEAPLACGPGGVFVPGRWAWNGAAWYWAPGQCVQSQAGYRYVPPSYSGGVYVREHWVSHGHGHHDAHHHEHHGDAHH